MRSADRNKWSASSLYRVPMCILVQEAVQRPVLVCNNGKDKRKALRWRPANEQRLRRPRGSIRTEFQSVTYLHRDSKTSSWNVPLALVLAPRFSFAAVISSGAVEGSVVDRLMDVGVSNG